MIGPTYQILDGIVIDHTNDGWTEFVKWLDGTYGALPIAWVEDSAQYIIIAIDDQVRHLLTLQKGDASEFEATYKVHSYSSLPRGADGKLVVASAPPGAPPGATEFVLAVDEDEISVGTGGDVASPHTTVGSIIENGATCNLQLIVGGTGGDPTVKGSKIEVYWREGAGPTDHLIERVYVAGQTVSIVLPDTSKARDGTSMVGNGTNTRIVVVRTRLSTAMQEIDFAVRGYTE